MRFVGQALRSQAASSEVSIAKLSTKLSTGYLAVGETAATPNTRPPAGFLRCAGGFCVDIGTGRGGFPLLIGGLPCPPLAPLAAVTTEGASAVDAE